MKAVLNARRSLASAIALALGLLVSPAFAVVQGGGPKAADCLAEFENLNATKGTRVECTDGDPACDTDGSCDGSCEFLVQLCLDRCAQPRTVERVRVTGATLDLPPLPATTPSCGGYASVVTRKKKGKKPKAGKAVVRLAAFANGKPKVDRDKLVLVCKPRTDACPPSLETKDDVVAALPPLSIDPPSPTGGGDATVTVDLPGASAITLTATGDGCGGFTSYGPSPTPLVVTRAVAEFGLCDLVASATIPSGVTTLQSRFEVTPRRLSLPAISVHGGTFLPGTLPPQTGGASDPLIDSITAPGSIIDGGAVQLRLRLADPTRVGDLKNVQIRVNGVGGHSGYYEAPVKIDGDAVVVELTFDGTIGAALPAGRAAAAAAEPVELLVQLVDQLGNVGNQVLRSLGLVDVMTGAVQVSLSWDTPTDVDLHVVEPGGEEIYYDHTTSETGGVLDLDSNPACDIDGVNNENITWTDVAPAGEYVVRVDYWSDCGGLPANFTVTTRVCSDVKTFTGSFAGGTSDRGSAGAGIEIARFSTNCTARVRGTATYEDFAQTTSGLATTSTMLPIRFAKLEVKRASDDATLATGNTKQDGTFDVRFTNEGTPGYYVVVIADQDDDTVKETVKNDRGETYSVRSDGAVDETSEPDKMDLRIEAKGDGPGPAFNIFDAGVVGGALVRSVHGATPPHLEWLWTSGKKGTCSGVVSCYDPATTTISVLSVTADPDEYDDLVLLHEYGHFYQYLYSRSDSPGGRHSSRSRVDSRLAWGEGSATFFGNLAKGTSLYLDTNARGIGVRNDIETLDADIPLGTSDGTQTGDLSEALVSAVLWDIADATNEPKDTLAKRDALFGALKYLGGASFVDRAATGADLVDVLDGWFCLGNGDKGDATSGIQANVVGLHQFNYDFAMAASCR